MEIMNTLWSTFSVVTSKFRPETGTSAPSSSCERRGVIRHALTVENAVMVTLSATSARASSVTRLLAVPPAVRPCFVRHGSQEKRMVDCLTWAASHEDDASRQLGR